MAVKKIVKNNENSNSTIEVVEKKENNDQGRQKTLSKSSNSNNSSFASNKNLEVIQKSIEARLKIFVDLSNTKLKKLVSIPKLMEAGVYVGLPSFLWNPKMKIFIYHNKSQKKKMIDILKIIVFLNRAYNFLYDIAKQGGKILFVGTHNDFIKKHIANEAKRVGEYFINQRWLGGTLTNYKTIVNSINKLHKLTSLFESEEINKYPKKEQVLMNKKIAKLTKFIGGIKNMKSLPNVIITIDPILEHNTIKEARQLKIPIISIANTNANPDIIDFVIPGNTNSNRSLWLLLSILADAIAEAKKIPQAVVGKKDDEIILPEIVRQAKRTTPTKWK